MLGFSLANNIVVREIFMVYRFGIGQSDLVLLPFSRFPRIYSSLSFFKLFSGHEQEFPEILNGILTTSSGCNNFSFICFY